MTEPNYKPGQTLIKEWGYEIGILSLEQIDSHCLQYWKAVANKHQLLLEDLDYEIKQDLRSPTGLMLKTRAKVTDVLRRVN